MQAIFRTLLTARSRIRSLATALLTGALCLPAAFGADSSSLPPLGSDWKPQNPYRGNAAAAAVGKAVFEENCIRCHGADATGRGAIGANLQLVGRFCRRIADDALKQRCLADADDFFKRSVQEGKIRVGITYMPPWKDVLKQEEIWALRTYVEALSQQARDSDRQ